MELVLAQAVPPQGPQASGFAIFVTVVLIVLTLIAIADDQMRKWQARRAQRRLLPAERTNPHFKSSLTSLDSAPSPAPEARPEPQPVPEPSPAPPAPVVERPVIRMSESKTEPAPLSVWRPILTRMEPDDPQHIRIIGATSDGKSYLAEALVAALGGKLLIIDSFWRPGNWGGLSAVTVDDDGDFKPIAQAHKGVMREMRKRRGEFKQGKQPSDFERLVVLHDEVPDTVTETDTTGLLVRRIGQAGRHGNIHFIGLGQGDRVGSWGLDGYGDSANNFITVLLGAKAIAVKPEAKQMRRPAVLSWGGLLTARYNLPDPLIIDLSEVRTMHQPLEPSRLFVLPLLDEEEDALTPDARQVLQVLKNWSKPIPPSKNGLQKLLRWGFNKVSEALLLLEHRGLIDRELRVLTPTEEPEEATEEPGGEPREEPEEDLVAS